MGSSPSAPTLGPRNGPGTGSTSVRLPVGLQGHGVSKYYNVVPVGAYRPNSRGGLGSTFGPAFGRPVKPRFGEPPKLTARAFNLTPLPSMSLYKEPQAPQWRMGTPSPVGRPRSRSPSTPMLSGRTSPQQWTPGNLENVLARRSYAPDDAMEFARPLALRPSTSTMAFRSSASSSALMTPLKPVGSARPRVGPSPSPTHENESL